MKALVLCPDAKKFLIKTVPKPVPQTDEALVKVLRAGICGTDINLKDGYMENCHSSHSILGHEFIGLVEEAPPNHQSFIGHRVCGEINLRCGKCDICLKRTDESRNHCPHRSVLGILNKNGAFAEYITLPIRCLHLIPGNISDENACFIEPLAAAYRIIEQQVVNPDDVVVVLGDGKLGLLIAQVLALRGSYQKVHIMGHHPDRQTRIPPAVMSQIPQTVKGDGDGMETASKNKPERLQSTRSMPVAHEVQIAWDEVPDNTADVVVDATNSISGLQRACEIVKPLGTIVLKSCCCGGQVFDSSLIVVKEIKVVGSRCGPFLQAIKLLETNAIHASDLLDCTYPLEEGTKAIEKAAESGLKVHIICSIQEKNS
eukprot:Platyproteum_vivax@DN4141_c0_g1_i1.p1